MQADAYATGSVLVALNKAGNIAARNEVWSKGVAYLLDAQKPDGSWHVTSRATPEQEYFESGFPHGKDQFISAFATGWAAETLLLYLSEELKPDSKFSGADTITKENRYDPF